ncbi:MAG: ThiF family adenylyltransferase [Candidatus Liptonbacteria bacterium]|nr:ThiF family adenylyltransferase [Candidatus Liptonbacteria bacterium]
MTDRFDRQVRFFGQPGQNKLASCSVAIVGVGGLGSHVVQQLALLGVRRFLLIDPGELKASSLNRYVGARYDDPIPGTAKVDIGERLIKSIDPNASIEKVKDSLMSRGAFAKLRSADYVFGCVDNEGARLVLTEFCAAYTKPYFDLGTGIEEQGTVYGGQVRVVLEGRACLVCHEELDLKEATRDLTDPSTRRNREAIYGVGQDVLGGIGPSVVSINGVIASLAVTEFLVERTGIRTPAAVVRYHAHKGSSTRSFTYKMPSPPAPDCYYCTVLKGKGDAANIERYI